MTHVAVIALLSAGCACEVVCVIGVLWMRSGFDQLHFSGAATTLGLALIGVAVVLQGFHSLSGTIDCVVALALTFFLAPVMAMATARAGRRMEYDTLDPIGHEFDQQP